MLAPSLRTNYYAALIFLLFSVAIFLAPGRLLADQVGLVASNSVSAAAGVNGENFSFSSLPTQLPFPVALLEAMGSSFDEVNGGAFSGSQGSVSFGKLTGAVSVFAEEASLLSPPGTALGFSTASATFDASWSDTLTVTSSTLAAGTPVNLLFTLTVASALSCFGPPPSVTSAATFQAGVSSINMTSTCNTSQTGSQTLLFATSVGGAIPIVGSLDLSAVANPLNFEPRSEGNIAGSTESILDPPSAAEFFIDSETAGASYTTASGNTYFSPSATPEPSSLLLFGTGLLGLIVFTKFKA